MPGKRRRSDQGTWLKAVAVILATVAATTAASSGGHADNMTTGDPTGCVILRV
jgi:hypothetical protein